MVAALLVCVASAASAAEMNISQFVFRDTNRNGVFDTGESPMPGVTIRLEQEGSDPIRRQSNLAGFTNFPMSSDEDKDITEPGVVSFSAELPSGYELTTGNPRQIGTIFAVEGSPSGFAMDPPMPFMGLAPTRTIESGAEGVASLTCIQDGTMVQADLWDDAFVCDGGPGRWNLTWNMIDGRQIMRTIEIADWPHRVPVFATDAVGTTPVFESFDDVIDSENIQEMASSDGYVWHNLIAVHRKFYGGYGYVNGTTSGAFAAYNSSGHPATLSSAEPFTFHGAFVSVAWPEAMKARVRITGYRKGQVVAEDAFIASNIRPVWFDANWPDIDRVVFAHDQYWQVVIDDLKVSRP